MRYGDVVLKDDGYHIKGPQDEKNLRKTFVIPRKTSEKFDCFLAFVEAAVPALIPADMRPFLTWSTSCLI